MHGCSLDLKAALHVNSALTPKMREHINKTRWTKRQHKLPAQLCGYSFDLNRDGVQELFIHTGECGTNRDPNLLAIRFVDGKAEIIAAIQGSFGLIKRENDWDDIVEFNLSGPT
jgi:hypothetical protein